MKAPAPPSTPSSAVAPPAAAPTHPVADIDPQADLAAKIDPIFAAFTPKDAMSPGCAVGIYRAGEVLFSKGYGYADLEHDAPITDATPFYSASVSKQFTTAAVLLLAAERKLSLDDDVRKFVPELHDFGTRITLDQMIHHTSGLRDYHLLLLLAGLNEEDVITSREVLWLISHQRTLGFPPGSRFSYSSSGYVLLAEIVARVSGESFGAFLNRRILSPLGMTSSFIREDHARLTPHRAIGYTQGKDQQLRMFMGNLEYGGSSTLVTTTRDLAKWDANFYEPKVGGQALIDAMRVRGVLTDGTVLDYARGLAVDETNGIAVEWHDGGFAGYRSLIQRYPNERLTVSVLCNTTEADSDALGQKVAKALLPKLTVAAPKAAPSPVTEPPKAVGFDAATLTGTYIDSSTAVARTIEVVNGTLQMRYGDPHAPPRDLVPLSPTDLLVKGSHVHYGYEPAKGKGGAKLIRRSTTEVSQTFTRMDRIERVDNLTEYAGRYGSEEFANDVEIRVDRDRLVLAPLGGAARRSPFTPVARDLFGLDDDDIGFRFERDARGKVIRLVASTDRAREVVLVRR